MFKTYQLYKQAMRDVKRRVYDDLNDRFGECLTTCMIGYRQKCVSRND